MANSMDAPDNVIKRSPPSQHKFVSQPTDVCGCPELQKNHLDSTASRRTNKPPLLPKPTNISALKKPNHYKFRHQFPSSSEGTKKTDKLEVNQIESELNKLDKTNHGFKPDDDVNSNISQVPESSILNDNTIDSENNNYSINNKCLSNDLDLNSKSIASFDDESKDMLNDQPVGDILKESNEDEKLPVTTIRKKIANWFGSFGKGNVIIPIRANSFSEPISMDSEETDTDSLSSVEYKLDDKHNLVSQPVSDSANSELNETKKKSLLIIEELISTEKVFIDVLKLLCKTFVSFVQKCENDIKIPHDVLLKIISPLPQLLVLNKKLLQDIEKRMENWNNNPKISDVIVKIGPFFKLYSTYYQNFESQTNLLDECCQKYPKFQKCVKDFEALDICKKLTIKHYMLKPIQRIPQYRLLLENYLKCQDENSIDYDDTKLALDIVSDVANHINKSLKKEDCLSKLLQIQSLLGNYDIIKPGREFIKEGELYKLSRKEMQLRNFILLNDCLLYTSSNGTSGLKINYELPLNGMKIIDENDYNNEFSVITKTRSFILRAQSSVEYEEWVTALKKAINEYKKRQQSFPILKPTPKYGVFDRFQRGNEAPVWVQDRRATMCQFCATEFTVTYRRHHCRACGKIVCRSCSENKAPLYYMKFQSARVCDDCFDYLLKEFEELLVESQKTYTDSDHEIHNILKTIKNAFKKSNNSKKHINAPQRLKEGMTNTSSTLMTGWLYQREKRKSWKKFWFVLKEKVLYVYKAPEDVLSINTMPILGYTVQEFQEGTNYEEYDASCVFQLDHAGQNPLIFYANSKKLAKKWVEALNEAQKL